MLHIERLLLEKLDNVCVNQRRVRGNRVAVNSEKNIDHGEPDPFVSIHERVVLNQAFQKRGGLMNQSVVIPRLRTMQSRFQRTRIADARRAAVTLDQLLMKEERIRCRDVLRHFAKDRYNSSRSLRLS